VKVRCCTKKASWGNHTQEEHVCCQAKCSLIAHLLDQTQTLCDRVWVFFEMYAYAQEHVQLVLGAEWVEQSCRCLLLGMTAATQSKTAQSTQACFLVWMVCSCEIHLVTIAHAHSQASSALGRHLRYLSQVAQHLDFCRVLSCCQCLLQGHT